MNIFSYHTKHYYIQISILLLLMFSSQNALSDRYEGTFNYSVSLPGQWLLYSKSSTLSDWNKLIDSADTKVKSQLIESKQIVKSGTHEVFYNTPFTTEFSNFYPEVFFMKDRLVSKNTGNECLSAKKTFNEHEIIKCKIFQNKGNRTVFLDIKLANGIRFLTYKTFLNLYGAVSMQAYYYPKFHINGKENIENIFKSLSFQ